MHGCGKMTTPRVCGHFALDPTLFSATTNQPSIMTGTTRRRRRRWCCGRCTRARPPWWRWVRYIHIHTHAYTYIYSCFTTHTPSYKHTLNTHPHSLIHPHTPTTTNTTDPPDASRAAGPGPRGGGEQPPHGAAHRRHAGGPAFGRAPHRVQGTSYLPTCVTRTVHARLSIHTHHPTHYLRQTTTTTTTTTTTNRPTSPSRT